jgi:hypothetical protein
LKDIDECNQNSKINECHQYADCLNTYGSYNCSCKDGFEGDGKYCQDIDECNEYYNPNQLLCNGTGICINTVGYFRCECLKGFEINNESVICTGNNYNTNYSLFFSIKLLFIDIDECLFESCFSEQKINEKVCYSFGLCRNTFGSFVCECFDGFKYDQSKGYCIGIYTNFIEYTKLLVKA